MSDLDANWIAVAQVFATLAHAATQQCAEGNVAQHTKSQAIRRSRVYEGRANAALVAAGVQG